MIAVRSGFALVLLCLAAAVAQATETERVHKVVPLGPGGTVKLSNFSGEVRITGADVHEVTVDAVRRASRDRLDHIKLDVSTSGSTVTIDANKKDEGWTALNNNVVETDLDIQVPRQTALHVKVFSSAVKVRGVSGEQTIQTFSGDARVEDVAARIQAKTFSGSVGIRVAPGTSAAEAEIETFSGSINLMLPEGVRAALVFDSFSGQLTSDWGLTLREQKKGHLRAELNGGDPQRTIRLKTFSGDVKIGK
jgi:hypothetical protein